MRLGVISDTHGHLEYARRAVPLLESFAVERVLHCGDIGSPAILELFAAWPLDAVLGNVDYDDRPLEIAAKKLGQTLHGRFAELELSGRKIAMLHGDDGPRLQAAIASGERDLVCHGHTHVSRLEKIGPTWVLNPGALYRAAEHTIAIVELTDLTATIVATG